MARYLVNIMGRAGQMVELKPGKLTIGRASECDISIRSAKISRVHCLIYSKGDDYYVQDMSSKNGTYVNAKLVEKDVKLELNDELKVGDQLFLFTDKAKGFTDTTQELSGSDDKSAVIFNALVGIAYEDDVRKICSIIIGACLRLSDCDRGAIILAGDDGSLPVVCLDRKGNDISEKMEFCKSILNDVLSKKVEVIADGGEKADYSKTMVGHQVRTVFTFPLIYNKAVIGALYLDNTSASVKPTEKQKGLLRVAVRYFSSILGERSQHRALVRELMSQARDLELEISCLKPVASDKIVGESDAIFELLDKVRKVASADATILLTGESGTGKELVARYVHRLSPREKNPFVVVDCANIPATLIESELYGYEKGSFTGASETRIGRIEAANNGTIFLDEIGELPLDQQKNLLRFLQEQEIYRIGNHKPIKVNVRVIAATNRDLPELVNKGSFREDLFYRLNVVSIRVPSLRERKDDIPLLAEHFVRVFCRKYGKTIKGITREGLDVLSKRQFKGNIRELQHIIEQAVILCDSGEIDESFFQVSPGRVEPLQIAREKFEKEYILNVLMANNFNVTKASKVLGISRQHLQNYIKKFGFKRP